MKHLRVGSRVRLSGTTGEVFTVESYRLSRHGVWYTFRSTDFGNTISGYADAVCEVL